MTSDENIIACLETLTEKDIGGLPAMSPPSPKGEALLKALREDHEIEAAYNERLHLVANVAMIHSLTWLARWMIKRSQVENAAMAVEHVRTFLSSSSFTGWAVLLLTGLPIDQEYDLGGEISLVPIDRLPTTDLQQLSWEAAYSHAPLPRPSGGLVFRVDHPRRDYPSSGDTKIETYTVETGQLEDARLCLGLCRPEGCGVQGIATTVVPEDDVPLFGASWSLHSFTPPVMCRPLIEVEAIRAKTLHDCFRKLTPEEKDKLRLPMERLNYAAATMNRVERASTLRTALDAVFLDDGVKVELVYRLSLRAALFTEQSEVERRREVKRLVTDTYKLCSTAVHEGRIPTLKGRLRGKESSLMKDTTKLLSRAIEMRMRQPKLDWEEVELSGGDNVIR